MSGWENPATGRRRRPALLILVAVIALAVVAWARAGPPTGRLEIARELVTPREDAPTAEPWRRPPPGRWQRLPPPPMSSRLDYTVAWTGSEMIVWGGVDARNEPRPDGASFDPARGTWRRLPAVAATDVSATAVVAGTDVVFVSARDTWRFDPADRRWRAGPPLAVPDGHILSDHIVAAGWVVLAITRPRDGDGPAGLFALRPGATRWQRLADLPVTVTPAHTALATGSRLLVFGPPVGDQPAGVAIDLDTAPPAWRPVAAPPPLRRLDLVALTGIAAGDRIMLWGARADASAGYAAVWEDGRWRSVDPGPLRPSRAIELMWTGGRMLAWDRRNNAGALFDPRTDRWARVPRPPVTGQDLVREAVWTGSELLVWGAFGTSGAIYTPE